MRECLNDTRIFSTEANEWKYLRTWGDFVEGRRNHAGVIFSKFLIVYGGINNNGHYLNDVLLLNLEALKWMICETENKDDPLAFHSMCAVFSSDIKVASIYHPYERLTLNNKSSNTKSKITEEGIYCFGGKDKNNQSNNILKILKLGAKPLSWIYPTLEGIGPSRRFQHTMTYQETLNLLVVYGGRDDFLGVFGDMFVLNLHNMTWYSVNIGGHLLTKDRFGHCSVSFSDKMLVFGGVSPSGFAKGELLIFEMSPKAVRKCIQEEEEKERQKKLAAGIIEKSEEIFVNNHDSQGTKAKNFRNSTQLLMDSLSFKNFKSYMPFPNKEENKEIMSNKDFFIIF